MRLLSSLHTLVLVAGAACQDLAPFKYDSFPLGSVKASGWLQDNLRLSGDGLAGNLFEFYRYVGQSTWVGGTSEYSDLRESATYWFNAIVPLAWSLDDDRLKGQAKQFLDYVLEHQYEDGWLGPEATRNERVIWGRSYLLLGMTSYAEAEPAETDRIVDAMHRYVALTHTMLQNNFTGLVPNPAEGDTFDDFMFGVARGHEYVLSLQWLLENHPRGQEQVLVETIELMFEGHKVGNLDWNDFFTEGNFPTEATPNIETNGFTHGVNTAEGLKYSTVLYRSTQDQTLLEKTKEAVALMQKYQTTLSGSVSGDEHLGGRLAERGSELCMVVESMFSYAYMYRFHGTNDYADMAERNAFNALPGGMTHDWWAHNYITQTNQPWARELEGDNPFYNVDNYALVYGLEPNYPCCTVNHPQGLPKFVTSLYARNGDNGIVHMLLSPATVTTKVHDSDVTVNCQTNYPFSDTLTYVIESDTDFSFFIRIPDWTVTDNATITLEGSDAEALAPDADNLHEVLITEGTTKFNVTLPMEVRTVDRDGGVAFYRGPLLYGLDIEHNETSYSPLDFGGNPLPPEQLHPDAYDVQYKPVSEWRYAVDPSTVTVRKDRDELAPLPNPLFVRGGPPTSLEVEAYPIEWPLANDTAAAPPVNPAVDASQKITVRLIPYGSAKLHIAQFPVAQL